MRTEDGAGEGKGHARKKKRPRLDRLTLLGIHDAVNTRRKQVRRRLRGADGKAVKAAGCRQDSTARRICYRLLGAASSGCCCPSTLSRELPYID